MKIIPASVGLFPLIATTDQIDLMKRIEECGRVCYKSEDKITEDSCVKFVENIIQATARDILAEAMLRLDAHGYKIVMHVHDEAVIEAPADTSLEDICDVMGQTPTWAKGLLLRADGYICDFYKKD